MPVTSRVSATARPPTTPAPRPHRGHSGLSFGRSPSDEGERTDLHDGRRPENRASGREFVVRHHNLHASNGIGMHPVGSDDVLVPEARIDSSG